MKTRKTMLKTAFVLAFGSGAITAHAATLNTGNVLTLTSGVPSYSTTGNQINVTGSWYGIDYNLDQKIAGTEKSVINAGPVGITIGHTQAPGPIDNWSLLGITGWDYTTIAPTGGTAGVNLSGWNWYWHSYSVNQGSNAWQPLNCSALGCTGYTFTNGVARFQWDGTYGHSYTLDYTAAAPQNDPTGWGGYGYYLHLEGTVSAVPIPVAAWLFGSGLMGLFGFMRRLKRR